MAGDDGIEENSSESDNAKSRVSSGGEPEDKPDEKENQSAKTDEQTEESDAGGSKTGESEASPTDEAATPSEPAPKTPKEGDDGLPDAGKEGHNGKEQENPNGSGNKPAAAEELPEHVLSMLDDCLKLPSPQQGNLGPSRASVGYRLALSEPQSLQLDVLGSSQIGVHRDPFRESFQIEVSNDSSTERSFDVVYRNLSRGGTNRILAKFHWKDGTLRFQPEDPRSSTELRRHYDVFRCCPLRVTYRGKSRIVLLKEPDEGIAIAENGFFEREWTVFVLTTVSGGVERSVRYSLDERDVLENDLPAADSLRLEVRLIDFLPREFKKTVSQSPIRLSKPVDGVPSNRTSLGKGEGKYEKFAAFLLFREEKRQLKFGIQIESKLRLLRGPNHSPAFELTKEDVSTELETLVVCDKTISDVGNYVTRVEKQLTDLDKQMQSVEDQLKAADFLPRKEKETLEKRKRTFTSRQKLAKEVRDAANAWLKTAEELRTGIRSRVGSKSADMDVLLFAEVSGCTNGTETTELGRTGIIRVPLLKLGLREHKGKSQSKGRLW